MTWVKSATGGDDMHAHDRTLLANMGFADKDRKNPTHDLACLYLSQPDQSRSVAEAVIRSKPTKANPKVVRVDPKLEFHLQKGQGQYATTIGFLDVVYQVTYDETVFWKDRVCVWDEVQRKEIYKTVEQQHQKTNSAAIFAEVKIEPVGYGEILRQINLYRSYLPNSMKWLGVVVITAWSLPDHDRLAIEQAGYVCLRLGDGFNKWVEALQANQHLSDSGL